MMNALDKVVVQNLLLKYTHVLFYNCDPENPISIHPETCNRYHLQLSQLLLHCDGVSFGEATELASEYASNFLQRTRSPIVGSKGSPSHLPTASSTRERAMSESPAPWSRSTLSCQLLLPPLNFKRPAAEFMLRIRFWLLNIRPPNTSTLDYIIDRSTRPRSPCIPKSKL